MNNVEAEENLTKAEFNFMVDSKTLIHKNWGDPKLIQFKIFLPINQNEGTRKEFFPACMSSGNN